MTDPVELFRDAVSHALLAAGLTPTRWHAAGVDCATAEGADVYLGLHTIARQVKDLPQEQWRDTVRDSVATLLAAGSSASPETPLAEVAEQLRPRVNVASDIPAWRSPIGGTGLAEYLVIDAPRTMAYVTPAMLAATGRPAQEWRDFALANLRATTPVDWLQTAHAPSGIRAGNVGDGYDAARSFLLADDAEGYFLALPSRDWLFALPLSPEAVEHLPLLKSAADQGFATDPHPISDKLYWVRGGVWETLDLTVTGNTLDINPSDALLAALHDAES